MVSQGCITRSLPRGHCASRCPWKRHLSACKSRRIFIAMKATKNWPKWGPRGTATVKFNLGPALRSRIKSTCKIFPEGLAGFASWKHCRREVTSPGGTVRPFSPCVGAPHAHTCVVNVVNVVNVFRAGLFHVGRTLGHTGRTLHLPDVGPVQQRHSPSQAGNSLLVL